MTPDQAREQANAFLASLYAGISQWDEALLDQAVLAIADRGQPFSANDLWQVVPPLGHGTSGNYFGALAKRSRPRVLVKVGEEPSVNPAAHGKNVNVYILTDAGRAFIEQRREQRTQQKRAAA